MKKHSQGKYSFFLAMLLLTLAAMPLSAESISVPAYIIDTVFNSKLKKDEAASLSKGEIIIRNIGNYRKICLKEDLSDKAALINSDFKRIKPSYLAETIQIRPLTESAAGDIRKLHGILTDVSNYTGIPYYSTYNKVTINLYASVELKKHYRIGDNDFLNVNFEMKPFNIINTDITAESTSRYLFYRNVNTTSIKYKGFITCVDPGEFVAYIYIFNCGNWQIIYGIGGADAPSFFFFKSRLNAAFIDRITSLCKYMCKFLD